MKLCVVQGGNHEIRGNLEILRKHCIATFIENGEYFST